MKAVLDYSVLYNDDDILVLNKRSGLLIAADRYDESAQRLDLIAEKEFGKLFAVHRLDKDTSGAIIYAKNAESHRFLSKQFEERKVEKIYHCLVNGHPLWETLHVDAKLLPDGDARHRTIPNQRFGKPAITDFKMLGACGPYSWIEARPHTGRTHQLRLAAADSHGFGKPIVGDTLYGTCAPGERLMLHAQSLRFTHPVTGEPMEFTSEPDF